MDGWIQEGRKRTRMMLWLLPEKRRKTEAFLTALWKMGEQNEDTSFLPSLIPLSPKTKEGKFARVEMERRAARRGACAVQCSVRRRVEMHMISED